MRGTKEDGSGRMVPLSASSASREVCWLNRIFHKQCKCFKQIYCILYLEFHVSFVNMVQKVSRRVEVATRIV